MMQESPLGLKLELELELVGPALLFIFKYAILKIEILSRAKSWQKSESSLNRLYQEHKNILITGPGSMKAQI